LTVRYERVPAGLGVALRIPPMDFETYSEAGFVWDAAARKWRGPPGASGTKRGLDVVGLRVYATHESTEVTSFYYDLLDGMGRRHWRPGLPPPQPLFDYLAEGGLIEAWSVGFEWHIWTFVCRRLYCWPELPQAQLRCAMAKAAAHAIPRGLDDAGQVLDLPQELRKDKDGTRLLNLFSRPRNPTKDDQRTRWTIYDKPEDGQKLIDYNARDIVAEEAAGILLPDLSPTELALWQCDQAINRRGVAIDMAGVEACVAVVEEAQERYNGRLRAITGGAVDSVNEIKKLTEWLAAQGVYANGLDDEEVERLLEEMGESPFDTSARDALRIRQAIGSASVKKVFAMRLQQWQGRLYELFGYHAARTGRANGNGPQPQNLPKSGPPVYRCGFAGRENAGGCGRFYGAHRLTCAWCGRLRGPAETKADWTPAAAMDALTIIMCRSLDLLELFFGDAMAAISGSLRALFVAAPGHRLLCVDYTAIEGVVTAALAGEEWRLEVYRTHGKMYETSASKITGVPLEEMLEYKKRTGSHHPDRNGLGKFAELASGFGGWIGAWKNFGAGDHMSDDQIKNAILAWRAASPMIVKLWGGQWERDGWDKVPCLHGLEGAALSAVLCPGEVRNYRGIRYVVHGGTVYCILLSGRVLTYHRARVVPSARRPGEMQLEFEGWNTNPKMGPTGWVTMTTYGGKLTENVVQATARDILAHSIIALEAKSYPIVLHVHDEIVVEMPDGKGSLDEMMGVMIDVPAWCRGWPIKVDGWEGPRYGK
jgi:DNA polymerase